MELEREHPSIKNSMLTALANVAPTHLLDRRLNPPAAIAATAALSETPEGASAIVPLLSRAAVEAATPEASRR
jgi:hypothetical protein